MRIMRSTSSPHSATPLAECRDYLHRGENGEETRGAKSLSAKNNGSDDETFIERSQCDAEADYEIFGMLANMAKEAHPRAAPLGRG